MKGINDKYIKKSNEREECFQKHLWWPVTPPARDPHEDLLPLQVEPPLPHIHHTWNHSNLCLRTRIQTIQLPLSASWHQGPLSPHRKVFCLPETQKTRITKSEDHTTCADPLLSRINLAGNPVTQDYLPSTLSSQATNSLPFHFHFVPAESKMNFSPPRLLSYGRKLFSDVCGIVEQSTTCHNSQY